MPALTVGESYAYYAPGSDGVKGTIVYLGIYGGLSPSNIAVEIEGKAVGAYSQNMHQFPNKNKYLGIKQATTAVEENYLKKFDLVVVPEQITKEIEETLQNKENDINKLLYNYHFNIVPKLLPLFSEEVEKKAAVEEKIRIEVYKKAAATSARPNLKAALNAVTNPINKKPVIGANRKRATRRRSSGSRQKKRKTTRR